MSDILLWVLYGVLILVALFALYQSHKLSGIAQEQRKATQEWRESIEQQQRALDAERQHGRPQ